jgi:hypothetical protein
VIDCYDGIGVECNEDQAKAAEAWPRQVMLDGMVPLIDPVPVVVEVSVGQTWAG